MKYRVNIGDALATMDFAWVGHADDVPGAVALAWQAARIYCPGSREDPGPFRFDVTLVDGSQP